MMQHIDLNQVSFCQDNSGELGGREPSRLCQAKLTDERYEPTVSTELNGEVRGCHGGCSPLGGEDSTPSCARELAKVAAPQHPPTGMALMQDGALNLAFVANALRFYANHIEGHPQRGDYFPADLRIAAQMLVAGTPPPSTHVAPWTPADLEIGKSYQAPNWGCAKYKGTDCYGGDLTYAFEVHRRGHGMETQYVKEARLNEFLAPKSAPELTSEQKEIALLRIIEAMGGTTDSSENPHSWLNWFCADEVHNVQEDTFNRCEAKGWIFTTHNSDWDTSTTTLTSAGRAVIASIKGAGHD